MIYRGWGILALLIPVCFLLAGISLYGVDGNLSLEVFLYSLLASGPVVYFLGIWLNRKSRHDMWFISMQYWGIIWAVIAVVILIIKAYLGK